VQVTEKAIQAVGGDQFKLILMAAYRAHQLAAGYTPLIEVKGFHKPSVIALMEIEAGAYTVEDYEEDKRTKTTEEVVKEQFNEESKKEESQE